MSRAPCRLRILGPPGVESPDGRPVDLPPGKPMALLVYLHVTGAALPRDEAARMFWPGSTEERSRGSLRQSVWLLRRRLGADTFSEDDPLRLGEGRVTSDLEELRAALSDGDTTRATDAWGGVPLEGLAVSGSPEWERWSDSVRTDLEHRLGSALADRARIDRHGGHSKQGVLKLRLAMQVDPDRLSHRMELAEALLDLRDFEGAIEVLLEARGQFDGTSDLQSLHALEQRVDTVRKGHQAGEQSGLRLEFTGHNEAFAALVNRWRQAKGGQASVGIITGEIGMGKSRLAEEVAILARAEGGRVIEVRAEDSERAFDWGLLGELVRSLFGLSGAAGISRASDGLLKSLVPSLSTGDGRGTEGPASPGLSLPRPSHALADALHDLVSAVSEDSPLLLVVDDLQWADAESRSVLARVGSRLRGSAVLLLVTSRTGPRYPGIGKTLAVLGEAPGATHVEVARWSREELSQALGWMARFSRPEESERLIERIYFASRGNPYFVMEALRVFQNEGILEIPPDGGWIFRVERLTGTLPLPGSLRTLIDQELGELSAAEGSVCSALARAEAPCSREALARTTGIRGLSLTSALSALTDRRMVIERPDGGLTLAHEGLRLAVLDFPWGAEGGERPVAGRRSGARLAGAAAALLVLVAVSAYLYNGLGATAPAPPFGGGSLFVVGGERIVELSAPGSRPSAWDEAPGAGWQPKGSDIRGPFRTTDGTLHWFENRRSALESLGILDLGTGGEESIPIRTDGVAELRALSPDGRYILFAAESGAEGSPREDLWLSLRDGSDPRRLHEGADLIIGGRWSADGRRLAFGVQGADADTVLVLAPDGTEVARRTVERLVGADWCDARNELVMSVVEDGRVRLMIWEAAVDRVEVLDAPGEVGRLVACSPDGAGIAFQSSSEGELGIFVLDRSSSAVIRLPVVETGGIRSLRWVSERLDPVPVGVDIRGMRPIWMDWGSRRTLFAEILHSDGTRREGPITWVSRDPGIASVNPDGVVTANQSGATRLLARFDGWLVDSIPLFVAGNAHPGTLLREEFDGLDPERWHPVGDPAPVLNLDEGSGVLRLRGGGIGWDGIISASSFPLPQGGTVEGEFLLRLTASHGQEVQLCLLEADPPLHEAESAPKSVRDFGEWRVLQETCVRYPAGRRARMNPRATEFWTHRTFPPSTADVGPHPPGQGWFHLAITLRPDGSAHFFVDREPVGTAAPRLANVAGVQWRVGVFGDAVATDAWVRNVTLWPGARY